MDLNHVKKPKKPVVNVFIRIGICTGVLLVGLIGMTGLASLKKPPAEVAVDERTLKVETLRVHPEDVAVMITGYGEVRALNEVAIAPEVAGRVVMTHPRLEVGEIISKGSVLFLIDTLDYSAAESEARASVQQWENTVERLRTQFELDTKRLKTLERNRSLAQSEFERLKGLFEIDNVGTRSGVDGAEQAYNGAADQADQMVQAVALYPIQIKEAQSALMSARARLTQAAANLKRCRVLAPFDGRVTEVTLETGQYAAPGQHVIRLADDSVLEIQVPLDSHDARRWIRYRDTSFQDAGKTAWFAAVEPVVCDIQWTENKDHHVWHGRLHRVVKFDQKTRTVTVAVRVAAGDAAAGGPRRLPLVEGMFCVVKIPGRMLRQAFSVPRQAVSFENTVYLARDRRLKTVSVVLARTEGESVYVTGGLSPGDQVITTRLVDPLENQLLEIQNSD